MRNPGGTRRVWREYALSRIYIRFKNLAQTQPHPFIQHPFNINTTFMPENLSFDIYVFLQNKYKESSLT